MKPSLKDLPYPNLPNNINGQINQLAEIIGIKRNLLVGADEIELEAMCYVVLYRHLSRHQRQKGMQVIRAVKKRALMGVLVDKALTTTFVNSQWGVWSLTSEELQADIATHEQIQYISSLIGIGASGVSVWDLVQRVVKDRSFGYKQIATLVIWGFVILNNSELKKSQSKLRNRTQLHTSRFFNNEK